MAVIWVFAALLACLCGIIHATSVDVIMLDPTALAGTVASLHVKIEDAPTPLGGGTVKVGFVGFVPSEEEFAICTATTPKAAFSMAFSTASLPDSSRVNWVELTPVDALDSKSLVLTCTLRLPHLSRSMKVLVEWDGMEAVVVNAGLPAPAFILKNTVVRYNSNTRAPVADRTIRFEGRFSSPMDVPEAPTDFLFGIAGSTCMDPNKVQFAGGDRCTVYGSTTTYLTPSTKSDTYDGKHVLWFEPTNGMASVTGANLLTGPFEVLCPAVWVDCLDKDDSASETLDAFPVFKMKYDSGEVLIRAYPSAIFEALVDQEAKFEDDFHSGREFKELSTSASRIASYSFSLTEDGKSHYHHWTPLVAYSGLTVESDHFPPPLLVSLDHIGSISPQETGLFQGDFAIGAGNGFFNTEKISAHICIGSLDSSIPDSALDSELLELTQNPSYSLNDPGPDEKTISLESGAITHCVMHKEVFKGEDGKKLPLKLQAQNLANGKGISLHQHSGNVYSTFDASTHLVLTPGTFLRHTVLAKESLIGSSSSPFSFDKLVKPASVAPHPRPRLHQAIATSYSSSAKPSASSSSIEDYRSSGQLVFWYGGSTMVAPNAESSVLGDLWVHDVVADSWTLLFGSNDELNRENDERYSTATVPSARTGAALAYDADNALLWLFGGANIPVHRYETDNNAFYCSIWCFDLKTRSWAKRGTLDSNISGVAGASMVVRPNSGGKLVIVGGVMRRPSGDGASYGTNLMPVNTVFQFDPSTNEFEILSGTPYASNYSAPLPAAHDLASVSSIPAMAFHSVAWDPIPDGAGSDFLPGFYVFGGLHPTGPFRKMRPTNPHNSAHTSSDSDVLGTLYRYSFGANANGSEDSWLRVWPRPVVSSDTQSLIPASMNLPGYRGVPRYISSTPATSADNQPGGRVLAAMTVGSDGNVYVYGGRGHALSVRWPADSSSGELGLVPTMPFATAAFHGDTLTGVKIQCYFTCPVAQHVFVIPAAALTAAGLAKGDILRDLDVLLRASGQWITADAAGNGSSTAIAGVDTWIQLAEGAEFATADEIETAFRRMNIDSFRPAEPTDIIEAWQDGEFLSFSPRDLPKSPRNALVWDGVRGVTVSMRIRYSGLPASSDFTAAPYVPAQEGGNPPASAVVRDAHFNKCRSAMRFMFPGDATEHYVKFSDAVPEVILRTHLPPGLSSFPAAGSNPVAQPQLDDLWRYNVTAHRWELLGASRGRTVSYSDSSRTGARGQVGKDYSWPGGRVGAALVSPRLVIPGKAVSDIFLVGGFAALRSADDDAEQFMMNNDYASNKNPCDGLACVAYTDTWSLDVAASSSAVCARTASDMSASCSTSYDALVPVVPFVNAAAYGVHTAPAGPLDVNVCSAGDLCNGGQCRGLLSQYYCQCDDYVPSPTCSSSDSDINVAKNKLKLSIGLMSELALPLFPSVAVHPTKDITVVIGGKFLNADGSFTLSNNEFIFAGSASSSDTYSSVTIVIPGTPPTWGNIDNGIAPSEYQAAWFTRDGSRLCVLSPTPESGMAVWCKSGDDAATHGGYSLAGPDADALRETVTNEYDTMHTEKCHAGNVPALRQGFSSAVVGDRLCIFSGSGNVQGSVKHFDNIWCFDPTVDLWCIFDYGGDNNTEPVDGAAVTQGTFSPLVRPGPRHGAAIVASEDGKFLYLFGGAKPVSDPRSRLVPALMRDLLVYSFEKDEWAFLGGSRGPIENSDSSDALDQTIETLGRFSRLNAPGARAHASAAMVNGLLYIGYGVTATTTPSDTRGTIFATYPGALHDGGEPAPAWANIIPAGSTSAIGLEPAWALTRLPTDDQNNEAVLGKFGADSKARGYIFGAQFFARPTLFFGGKSGSLLAMASGVSLDAAAMYTTVEYPYYGLFSPQTLGFSPSIALLQTPCAANLCSAKGTKTCATTSKSIGFTPYDYVCECKTGFSGIHCEHPAGFADVNCARGSQFNHDQKKCVCGGDSRSVDSVCAPKFSSLKNVPVHHGHNGASTTALVIGAASASLFGDEVTDRSTMIFSMGGIVQEGIEIKGSSAVYAFDPVNYHSSVYFAGSGSDALHAPDYAAGIIGSRFGHSISHDYLTGDIFVFGGYALIGGEFTLTEDLWRIKIHDTGPATAAFIMSPSDRKGKKVPITVKSGALSMDEDTGHQWADNETVSGFPGARAFHNTFIAADSDGVSYLYVFGGVGADVDNNNGMLAGMWRIPLNSASGQEWTYVACSNKALPLNIGNGAKNAAVKDACPAARSRASFVASNNKAYLVGGVTENGPVSDLWVFSPETNTWTNTVPSGPTPGSAEVPVSMPSMEDSGPYHTGALTDTSCAPAPYPMSGVICYGGTQPVGPSKFMYRSGDPVLLPIKRSTLPALRFPFQPALEDGVLASLSTVLTKQAIADAGITDKAAFTHIGYKLWDASATSIDYKDMTLKASIAPSRSGSGIYIPIISELADFVVDLFKIFFNPQADKVFTSTNPVVTADGYLVFKIDNSILDERVAKGIVITLSGAPTGGAFQSLVYTRIASDGPDFEVSRSSTEFNVNYPTYLHTSSSSVFRSAFSPSLAVGSSFSDSRKPLGYVATSSARLFSASAEDGFLPIAGSRGNRPDLGQIPETLRGMSPTGDVTIASHYRGFGVGDGSTVSAFSSIQDSEPFQLKFDGAPPLSRAGLAVLTSLSTETSKPILTYVLVGGSYETALVAAAPNGDAYSSEGLDATFTPQLLKMPLHLNMEARFGGGVLEGSMPGVPVPAVSSAKFETSTTAIRIQFTAATNQPSLTKGASAANCNKIFVQASVDLFGSDPLCQWVNSATFRVSLGKNFAARVGSQLTLKGDVVSAAGYDIRMLSVSVALTANFALPVPVVNGPAEAGTCETVHFSALTSYGSIGMAFAYQWKLLSGNSSEEVQRVNTYLDSLVPFDSQTPFSSNTSPRNLPSFSLDMSLFDATAGPRLFELRITAWHSGVGRTEFPLQVHLGSVPTVAIAGAKNIVSPMNRNIIVNAELLPAAICGDMAPLEQQTLSYEWTLVATPPGVSPDSVQFGGSHASLRLRAYSLKPTQGSPYLFRVTVTSTLASGSEERSSSDMVSITVPDEPVRPVLRGGSGVYTTAVRVVIDGSESWDPMVNPATADPRKNLQHMWRCRTPSGSDCLTGDAAAKVNWNAPELVLSPEVLEAIRAGAAPAGGGPSKVTLTLRVARSGSDSWVSTSESVTLLSDMPYSLLIIAPNDPLHLDPTSPVTLTAVVTATNVTDIVDRARPAVVWVVDSNNYALSTSGALLPSSAPEMTLIDAQGGTYISSLRFPPGAIDANIELTIRASLFIDAPSAPVAVDPATGAPADLPAGPQNGEILSVTTMIKGNSAPSGGSCYPVFPAGADAAAGGKTFSLECSSWDDAEGNTPLRYQWLLRSRRVRGSEIEETLVEIGMPLPSPVLETSLEPGIEEDDYERRVVVVITDTLGAETTVEVAIPFVQSGSGSIAPAPPVLSQTAGFIAQAVPNGGLVFTPAAPLRALPTRARAFRGLAVDTRPHSSRADVPGRHSRVFAALSTAAPRAARVASKALDRVLNRALLPAPAQPRSVSLVNAVAPSATASSATKLDGLFSQLTAARATDEIRSVVQVALRISDVLEDTSNGLSIAQESAARVRLISALSAAFNLLTLSQDARRSAAATTDGASDGAFLALEGNSEIAIELLMQSCGDGSLLGGEERANTLRFLLSQMAELTAFDKVLGVAPRTVDTAAGLLGSVVGSFSSSIGLINPNATLPASGTEPSVEDDQAALVKAVAEAKRTANLLATQINVAEIARSRKQMLGANIAPVARNGITTLSLPVSVEDIPASVSAPVGGSSSGSVSVALPQWALKALGPRELQVVLGVVENPDLLLLAGLDDAGAAAAAPGEAKEGTGHLNATRSSALVSLTVFNRDNTAFNTDVPVSDGGFTIPVPKSEVFALPREALDLGGYVADVKPLAGFGASRPLSASYDFSAPRGGSGGVNDTEAFEFTIPHEAPTWHDVTFSCEWWQPAEDGNGGSWSTDGCVLVSTASDNSTTVCRCVHLTMFRVRMSLNDMIPRFNTIKPSDFLNLTVANIREHPVPLIVCLVWFGVYVLFFFLGAWIDKRKDARALRKYHNEWRPTAESAAATAAAIKALKDEDRRVGFCGRWWLQLKYSIRHDHMWLSVFLRDDTNAFSSTGRVTAAFVLILTGYMINAIFFGTAMGFGTIIKSLCAAVIILPVGMFMIVLFHHTQQGRIKDALYAYAEHLAFLKWTGRDADPEFAGKMEHQLRANPDIPSENIVPVLASIASSAGWQVGPGNAHVLAEHRGKRDELALRGKLRLLVHVDYDFLLVWYQQWTWRNSFPRGIRLVGYVLLWIWILACVMLILVYGMQFDLVEGSSTAAWLQSSAISNALEIFIFKPLFVPFRVFCCLGLAALCCAPAPCLPTRTSKDDALTVFESWEIHSDATGTCKTTVGDGGVGLELDVGNDAEDEAAMDAANRAAAAKYHASQERVLVAAPAPPTASSSSLASAPPPPAARSAAPVMGVSSSGTPLPPPGPRSHASHRPPPLLSSSSSAGAAAGAGAAGGEMEMAPMNLSSPFAGAATTIGEEDDDYDDGLPLGARAGGFDD